MTKIVESLRGGWNTFWFDPQPPHTMAIFRVLLGAFFLIYWLVRAPHVSFLFTTDGFHFPMYDPPDGGIAGVTGIRTLLGALTVPVAPWVTWLLYSALIVSLTLFTVGWWTRFAAASNFLIYVYFYHLELHQLNSSYDRLFLQISLLMCFSHCDTVISLHAWRRRRAGLAIEQRVPFWPARLIALQGMLVYFGTGFHKAFAPSWAGGEVLYYNLIGHWGSPLAFGTAQLGLPMAIYDVLVYATIVFELLAPLGLYVKRFQPWYFTIGFFFHLNIAVTLQIWQFMAVPATYVLYLDPERVRRWWETLEQRLDLPREPSDSVG